MAHNASCCRATKPAAAAIADPKPPLSLSFETNVVRHHHYYCRSTWKRSQSHTRLTRQLLLGIPPCSVRCSTTGVSSTLVCFGLGSIRGLFGGAETKKRRPIARNKISVKSCSPVDINSAIVIRRVEVMRFKAVIEFKLPKQKVGH